ncbi:MAG TPA: sugar ABC transporter permease [Gaiellaceae bacterium]|nr:sugar ABC transporter permease [Gaiellaceae bacterium]
MSERRGLALLLAPYLLGLTVLIAVPAAITFGLALFEYDLITSPEWAGGSNFRELWGDDIFRRSLRNSLMFIAAAVPLRLLGALLLALLLHPRIRGVSAYRTAAYLPTVVPDVAFALLMLWIFNPLYGPLNVALDAIGAPTPQWLTDPHDARWAVVLMSLFQIGEGFIVALAVRQSLPGDLYELAEIEGATPGYVFARVTLPLMAPALLLLLFRDTIFSFQANFVPALLIFDGGPPPYATTYLPLYVYTNAFEYLRYGYAAAAALVMFGITAAIVFAQWRILRRWRLASAT